MSLLRNYGKEEISIISFSYRDLPKRIKNYLNLMKINAVSNPYLVEVLLRVKD
ncbi:hypothetical protein ES708_27748 [subsurface metagenome]